MNSIHGRSKSTTALFRYYYSELKRVNNFIFPQRLVERFSISPTDIRHCKSRDYTYIKGKAIYVRCNFACNPLR